MNRKAAGDPRVLLALLMVCLAASGVGARDRLIWFLEVAPVFVGVPILVATYRVTSQLMLHLYHERQLAIPGISSEAASS